MRDMQASGNSTTDFSHNLSDFISATNYYLKSGYFSPLKNEISLIYSFYTELSKMILIAKADMKSNINRRDLYKDYCKIRQMLSSSFFVNVTILRKDECSVISLKSSSLNFEKIFNLYDKCKCSFPYKKISGQTSTKDISLSFYKRDVLIGVLRNREQLDISLKNGFYHIPYDKLPVPVDQISYIAIYKSKNLFGQHAGIEHYGKIDSCELVKRCEITEIPKASDKQYYRFNISNWETLPNPICNNGGGKVFDTTSQYLLLTSNDMCELNFKDLTLCKLYRTIRKSIIAKSNRVACRYRHLTFTLENNTVSVYINKKKLYSVSTEDYLKNPSKHFWSMINIGKSNKIQ